MPPRLEIRGLSKRFGATLALDGVDLEVAPGEVHAVVGENGAGKSTLMAILAGAEQPDSGQVRLDGTPFSPADPLAAQRQGVAIVHQEPMLCPHLSIAENVLLGREPTRWGVVDRSALLEKAAQALAPILPRASRRDLRQPALCLSASERQLVAIARATASHECRLLILDEPTSSLTAADVEHLFGVVDRLKQRGVSVLYVSHWLEELTRVADRYSVLRDGRQVATGAMGSTTERQLVGLMAGRDVAQASARSMRTPGEIVLRVEALSGHSLPQQASFELRRGEVLGIAGLIGSGRSELLRAVFGLDAVATGKVSVMHHAGSASPASRWQEQVGFVSEDRKAEGLAHALSLASNLTLTRMPAASWSLPAARSKLGRAARSGTKVKRGMRPWFVSLASMHQVSEHWCQKLGIRCRDVRQPVAQLSGGNQQKVALARLLYHDVDVYLLDEPTRGIDAHSRAFVHGLIEQLATEGKAVLMVSSYLPELSSVCDRIQVMHAGRLGPSHDARTVEERELLAEAMGL